MGKCLDYAAYVATIGVVAAFALGVYGHRISSMINKRESAHITPPLVQQYDTNGGGVLDSNELTQRLSSTNIADVLRREGNNANFESNNAVRIR
jgi:hypothetical protein